MYQLQLIAIHPTNRPPFEQPTGLSVICFLGPVIKLKLLMSLFDNYSMPVSNLMNEFSLFKMRVSHIRAVIESLDNLNTSILQCI